MANKQSVIYIENDDEVNKEYAGPSMLEKEIEEAINDLRNGKVTGSDDVPVQFLTNLEAKPEGTSYKNM